MNITDVRVKVLKNDQSKLRGLASIVIDEVFAVHDIKLIDGKDGIFVVMPSRKTPSGEYKDIAHPLKTEVREQIKNLVLAAYDKANAEINNIQ